MARTLLYPRRGQLTWLVLSTHVRLQQRTVLELQQLHWLRTTCILTLTQLTILTLSTTRPQHTGPQHTGPQHTGPQHMGPQHMGPQNTRTLTPKTIHTQRFTRTQDTTHTRTLITTQAQRRSSSDYCVGDASCWRYLHVFSYSDEQCRNLRTCGSCVLRLPIPVPVPCQLSVSVPTQLPDPVGPSIGSGYWFKF